MSWLARWSDARAAAAKSGVPANTSFIDCFPHARSVAKPPAGAPARSHRRALLLLHPGGYPLLFQPRQVFDEDFAFEVIDFVLYTYSEEAFGVDRKRLAVHVERPHLDLRRAPHGVIHPRHGQAA